MPDDMIDDDFEVDTTDLDVPADAVDNTDDAPADDDFDFSGLTDAEIEAINSEEPNDSVYDGDTIDEDSDDDASDVDDSGDTDGVDASDAHDNQDQPDSDTDDRNSEDSNDTHATDAYQQEVAATAGKRTAIDAEFDAKLAELEDLGKQYDDGDILDGAYNAQKARIERELKRIEVREAELVTKEDEIAARESSDKEQQQQAFDSAVTDFMSRSENSVFVEGSPEFNALDQQIGAVAAVMPPGTPFDVLLDKARNAVGVYMDLPAVEQKSKPDDKPAPQKDTPDTMPSISSMPSVVPNSTDDNKFAHLDKLSGDKLERALADMTPEQEAEYLMQ